MTPELKMMIEDRANAVGRRFEEVGAVVPGYFAVKRDDETFAFAPPPGRKDESLALVRAAFEVLDVIRYVFVHEAWLLEARGDLTAAERKKIGREGIADHPDRIEVLMIIGEDAEGMTYASRRIVREPGHKPRLGPLKIVSYTETEGRMVGLLPKPKGARVQ